MKDDREITQIMCCKFELDITKFGEDDTMEQIENSIRESLDISNREIFDFCVSIEEMLQNSYVHGLTPQSIYDCKNTMVSVELVAFNSNTEGGITLIALLTDHLKEFNLLQDNIIKQYNLKKRGINHVDDMLAVPIGGWGVDIILMAKDEIGYAYNNGNKIFIRKTFKKHKPK